MRSAILGVAALLAAPAGAQQRPPRTVFGAVHDGDIEAVRTLLAAGSSPHDQSGSFSQYPIQAALQSGRTDIAKVLLDAMEAPFVAPGGPMPTPVVFLIATEPTLVDILIQRGADLNARDPVFQNTVAHKFVHSVEVLRTVAARGCKLDLPDRQGQRPLHLAASGGHLDTVQYLLGEGAELVSKTEKGASALHLAARHGHAEIVQLLLQRGSPIEAESELRTRPLHLAAFSGEATVVHVLLARGATVQPSGYGDPVEIASRLGHVDILAMLKDHGEDVMTVRRSTTPIQNALRFSHTALARWLVEQGAKLPTRVDGLPLAMFAVSVDMLQFLADMKVDIHAPADDGRTALHGAAVYARTDVAKFLAANGADVDALTRNRQTPLFFAARSGNLDAIELFLTHAADVSIRDANGRNALFEAAGGGHSDAAQLLLDAGIPTNARDTQGNSPLHFAAASGELKLVKALLKHGASRNLRNHQGETPYDFAKRRGHDALLDELH